MLSVAVRKLVTLQDSVLGSVCDLLEKLGDPEWISALKKFLRKENPWGETTKLLSRVASVEVAGSKRFVAKDHIQAANIGWMSDNFKKLFLNFVEDNVEGGSITIHRLEYASLDVPILTELGDRAQISLIHLFELLKKQSKGESGPLLTNGCANIAYIIGSDSNLWAVNVSWDGARRCWGISAHSVGDPHRWRGGDQVLSRDS